MTLLSSALGNEGFGERACSEWVHECEDATGDLKGRSLGVVVLGTCAGAAFLHGGIQFGLAQLLTRAAARAAVAWYVAVPFYR